MPYNQDIVEELKLLNQFQQDTNQQGIKVHSDAPTALVSASQRLFEKGLITQTDGGYLTDLGQEAHHHHQSLMNILGPQ